MLSFSTLRQVVHVITKTL